MALYPLASVETPAALRRRLEAVTLPQNFARMLDELAGRFGEAEAWRFIEAEGRWKSLSYTALRDTVFRVADALDRFGIRRGDHVIVMANNRPEFPLVWLALGCLGAVMVPANIKYTAREIDYLVSDAEVSFAIVDPAFLGAFREAGQGRRLVDPARMVLLGSDGDGLSGLDTLYDAASPRRPAGWDLPRDTIVNIQYTSGTTGFPKGCLLTHDYWMLIGLVSYAQAGVPLSNILIAQHFYYLDPQLLLMLALLAGATCFIVTKPSLKRFMDWVRDYQIHYCILFEPVFKAPPDRRDGDNALRVVNTYGFTPINHAPFEKRFNTRAREAFGMTEVGAALYVPVERADYVGSGACGIPVPFREAKVMLDRDRDSATRRGGRALGEGPLFDAGLLEAAGGECGPFRRRLVSHRRPVQARRRGLLLLPRPQQGYDPPQRRERGRARGRDRAARDGRDRGSRCRSRARRAEGRGGQGLYPAASGHRAGPVSPAHIMAHCAGRLARFKIPRYIAFVDSFPMTMSDRVEKKVLVASVRIFAPAPMTQTRNAGAKETADAPALREGRRTGRLHLRERQGQSNRPADAQGPGVGAEGLRGKPCP